mmetsp:Transcript_27099/g.69794  ORF Transcript_27099/g.69794 Transcript_27099/m.69794 type:complete len:222 (+) Transcript_27099:244-909(+)
MLPLNSKRHSAASLRRNLSEYVRRLFRVRQMDLEYTLWQMGNLCFRPKKVYRTTAYHRQTKLQWARDDPAFVAILSGLVAVASLAYCIAFGKTDIGSLLLMVVKGVLIDFLAVGVVLCSVCWLIANIYLREKEENHTQGASGPTEDDVEWLYAFDVHCNSYVPVCLLLYYLQFLLLPLLNTTSIFSAILSNLLYLGAFIYYNYITFLGYNSEYLKVITGRN